MRYSVARPLCTRMALANDDKAYRKVDKLTLKYCKFYGNEFKFNLQNYIYKSLVYIE